MLKVFTMAKAGVFLAFIGSIKCGPTVVVAARAPSPDPGSVEAALRQALKTAAPALAQEIDNLAPGSLRITSEASRALPGVSYHWTAYSPPRSADLVVSAVVATVAEAIIPLQEQADWGSLLERAGQPVIPVDSAMHACEELVRTTSAFRSAIWPAIMYRDSAVLRDWRVRGATLLRTRTGPPEIVQVPDGSGLSIRAWFLESGRAAKFECRFSEGLPPRYDLIEHIAGVGLPRVGP